ncbi:MAG: superoxide dismutase [Anaerolineae bacterium]|nr:superoxide dismutase [Anaerolineae bacterium]
MKRFSIYSVLLLLMLTLAGGVAFATPGSDNAFPENIQLPDGFFPEGIVVGNGSEFYVGSLSFQGLLRGDLRTGELVLSAPGQQTVGLTHDARTNYVYAAGGPAGTAYVYDGVTLELLYTISFPGAAFVNDAIIARNAVYFTDSFVPVLYRVGLDKGEPDLADVTVLPMNGFVSGDDFNANGIAATENGKTLIVVNSSTGLLYNVDPTTGDATEIDLGGETVLSGDGIVLSGRTLYVVQNAFQQVSKIALNSKVTTGVVQAIIPVEGAETPTTADIFGNSLYLVDARFGTNPETTTYQTYRIDK